MPENTEPKEPFIAKEDRPDVTLHPDLPISQLRVRDLQALLRSVTHLATGAAAQPQVSDEIKNYIIKGAKESSDNHLKLAKEVKEIAEKHPLTEKSYSAEYPVNLRRTESTPDLARVIENVSALSQQVERLTEEIEKLRGPGR